MVPSHVSALFPVIWDAAAAGIGRKLKPPSGIRDIPGSSHPIDELEEGRWEEVLENTLRAAGPCEPECAETMP